MSTPEFNALVVNHAASIKPYAITLTKDHESAQDLCQETLYKALAHRSQYQPGSNIKAWLCTIMRNIFINDYRRAGRKKQIMDAMAYSSRYGVLHQSELLQLKEINHAIYQLPAIFKTACQLYLQGYKYHEIAQALNEPLGTIKSRIHFARKLLKKQITR